MTSSLLGVFLVMVEIVRRERREDAKILGRKTLFAGAQVWKAGTMCGVEGRYDSRRAGRRSCRYSGGSHEMRRETSARVYGNDPKSSIR